jgi:hypothetical protein
MLDLLRELLPIFGNTVLPVFLVAGSGFLLARIMQIEGRTLGRVIFYLATPSLVFRGLYQSQIEYASLGRIALSAATVMLFTGVAGWIFARDQARRRRVAVTLSAMLSNNGNMGLPISFFALGNAGLALATIYYITNSFLGNTVGVFIASMGRTGNVTGDGSGDGGATLADAFRSTLKVPILYAAVLGLAINAVGWTLPLGVFRPIDLLADMAIPAMLVLLGIQLSSAPLVARQGVLARVVAIRLLGGPAVALGICLILGITGMERSVILLQSAMPTAVITTVLATEYDAAPRFVATVIFFTTLVSMVTLSLLLSQIL